MLKSSAKAVCQLENSQWKVPILFWLQCVVWKFLLRMSNEADSFNLRKMGNIMLDRMLWCEEKGVGEESSFCSDAWFLAVIIQHVNVKRARQS